MSFVAYSSQQISFDDSFILLTNRGKSSSAGSRLNIFRPYLFKRSNDNRKLAEENNIELVTTNLTGRKSNDILAGFELSEDSKTVFHNVSQMSVRGLRRCRLFFGLKVGASNIRKFCRFMQSFGLNTKVLSNA